MRHIADSELILNQDGSIYHLGLHPEDIATTIITVGDPKRVEKISRHFDSIEVVKEKREFLTHTGRFQGKRLTVISTGIGTDNVDIVLNELDALVNIDLPSRTVKSELTRLKLIRIGTSGAISPDIPIGTTVVSRYGIGLDGLLHAYQHGLPQDLAEAFVTYCNEIGKLYVKPYSVHSSFDIDTSGWTNGITLTCPGFYAPQFRQLRIPALDTMFLNKIKSFRYEGIGIANMEMETAGLYGLANMMGHDVVSISATLAHRMSGQFVENPYEIVDQLIKEVLERL